MKKNEVLINKIAILLTVFNRKEKTLTCLNTIFKQVLSSDYLFKIYMVDDGSTDGTAEEVKIKFPSVQVIKGDGNLYWNRGMHTAWKKAAEDSIYDYFLWLNDDTYLQENAFSLMLNSSKKMNDTSIICGATTNMDKTKTTYSGTQKVGGKLLDPNGSLQKCEIFNGNFVLVPKSVYKVLGNLDWTFRHAIGDFDYALRAKASNINCFLAPEYIGICESNPTLPKWCLPQTPLLDRFKILYSPLGYADPIPFFIYEKRHFGTLTAIKHFLSINLRAFIPSLWKKK